MRVAGRLGLEQLWEKLVAKSDHSIQEPWSSGLDPVVPATQGFFLGGTQASLGPVKEGFLEETSPGLCFEGPVRVREKWGGSSR